MSTHEPPSRREPSTSVSGNCHPGAGVPHGRSFAFQRLRAHESAIQPKSGSRVRPFADVHMTADEIHERRIEALMQRWLAYAETGHPEARKVWKDCEHAIAQRSPEQVARMERERGL